MEVSVANESADGISPWCRRVVYLFAFKKVTVTFVLFWVFSGASFSSAIFDTIYAIGVVRSMRPGQHADQTSA
jgi:hypothetical protein